MSPFSTLCGLLPLLLILLLASTVSAEALAEKPAVIRIGVATQGAGDPPTFGGSPAATVQQQGLLEKEFQPDGIKVEWVFFKGAGPAVNEALANHQLDFAFEGDLPAVLARANGIKTRLLLASGVRSDVKLGVPAGSEIHSIKDLKGHKVGIFRGTNMQLVVDGVLAANGLSERDLQVINLDTSSALAALAAKGIDASFSDFSLYKLQDLGLIKVIDESSSAGPQFTRQGHLLVLDDFDKAHPDLVQRVVTQFVQGSHWSSEESNRAAQFKLWAQSGIPEAVWATEYKNDQLKVRNSPLIDPFLIARYTAVANQALQLKLIRQPVEIDTWFEPVYLDHALHELKLEHYWTRYDASGKALS